MKVKPVMFAIELCDKCRNDKILGDSCIKCKLDRVVKAKVDLNIEQVGKINDLEAQVKEYEGALKYYGNRMGMGGTARDVLRKYEVKK